MTNAYADLATLKGSGLLNISGTGDDARLRQLLEDVSQQVDRWCNRHFHALTATRYFDGPGGLTLLMPDLISMTTLKEDGDNDGVYETAWAATDYLLQPPGADPTGGSDMAGPYTALEVNRRSNGTKASFPAGQRRFEVAGVWGYWRRTEVVTTLGAEVSSTTATSVSVASAASLSVGHTALVDSEQMYVTAVSGTTLTVRRGVNGTAAATHSNGASVSLHRYPGPVAEATLMQSARLWKRGQAGFAGVLGMEPTGQAPVRSGLDLDVREMLGAYRRSPLGTG